MTGSKMSEKARELVERYAGDWELIARAVHNLGKGKFETYYLVLDQRQRKRWTPLSELEVKGAFWVLSSAVVFGTTSRGRPNAEIHAILDRAVCGITSDDENLFAACALNFAGSHIRLHGEVVVSYLAHTRAWQWHIDICARLDIATAQRTAWDTLWDDRRQSRTAQLRQAIKSGSTETDESARARLPVCLRSAYQALLGKALVMSGLDDESPFECFYLIRRKGAERGEWVSETSVDDYFVFAYTMLGAHYTGSAVVPHRTDAPFYIGFLENRLASIDRSIYRASLKAHIKASTAASGGGQGTEQDSEFEDSDATDPEQEPALGIIYSSPVGSEESDEHLST